MRIQGAQYGPMPRLPREKNSRPIFLGKCGGALDYYDLLSSFDEATIMEAQN